MTRVRGLVWTACVIAAGAWAGAVVAGRRATEPVVAPPPVTPASSTVASRRAAATATVVPPTVATSAPAPATNAGAPAIEPRTATLVVHLRSDATGDPVESSVRLWRLGLPETDAWTAGDEEARRLTVVNDGASIPGLPAGRYRLQILDLRHGAKDPPAFDVEPGRTKEATFAIADRRVVRTRMLLVGPDGTPLARCERRPLGRSYTLASSEGTPDWAQRREPKSPTNDESEHHLNGSGPFSDCGHSDVFGPLAADADRCFDLATHRERGRNDACSWRDAYSVDGCNDVEREADDQIAVDTTFIGVVVPTSTLVARVVGPNGTRVDPSRAAVTARCDAIRAAWTPPANAWRTVAVRVKVDVDGCDPLEFLWAAASADVEHRLVARSTSAVVDNRRRKEPVRDECAGAVPDDEMEHGTATLRLRLRCDADDAPVAMRVRLWRLDVPADARWSEGDEMRGAVDVPVDGCVVERLPPGRYRLQCLDARKDGEDPPAFDVADGANERDARVPNRRMMRLHLRLVDEHGALIRDSMRCPNGGARGSSSDEPHATWANPRRPLTTARSVGLQAYRVGHSRVDTTGPVVNADDEGYLDVGSRPEAPRHGYSRWMVAFRTDGRATVVVNMFDDVTGDDWKFVGTAPKITTLVAGVVRPDGRPFEPGAGEIDAYCVATQFAEAPPADAWRTVPVHVEVNVAGCETLKFVWTAATAEAKHRLVASPVDSPK